MIEVADLEVQEQIKAIDASFTWPHPTLKGYSVSAAFVRTESDKPYLVYCPRTFTDLKIDNQDINLYFWNKVFNHYATNTSFINFLCLDGDESDSVYFIPLFDFNPKEVKKERIEKLFNIKVVD